MSPGRCGDLGSLRDVHSIFGSLCIMLQMVDAPLRQVKLANYIAFNSLEGSRVMLFS